MNKKKILIAINHQLMMTLVKRQSSSEKACGAEGKGGKCRARGKYRKEYRRVT
jgi:hypothetical protein